MISDIEYDNKVRETIAKLEAKSENQINNTKDEGRLRMKIKITKIADEEASGIGLIRRDTGEFYPIGAGTRIGRAADNDIVIAEPKGHFVSAHHAEIDFDDFDYYIRDHEGGSTNGTFVNGNKIDEASISIGDRIRLADIDFTVIAR